MYWENIDENILTMLEQGYAKLPPLNTDQAKAIAPNIIDECNKNTFSTGGDIHKKFLEDFGVFEHLAPKLYEMAKNQLGYKGGIDNQYHVARHVEPGNSVEQYRAHFDSHLVTLVIPIQIPESISGAEAGQLIFLPKARNRPRNELSNIVKKTYFKRYASRSGMEDLGKKSVLREESFRDMRPIMFLGNTTLHTNRSVSEMCKEGRLTLLSHFFDPSPKFGIGNFLRKIRRR